MKLPIYKLSIDDLDCEDGEYLGTLEIANTSNPAIQMKGIAFSNNKPLHFADELKMRIASPVLLPSKIYRRDEATNEEYYVEVTPKVVEQMFVKFMKDRAGKDIFNVEHDESKRVPSYILETWLIEQPKLDKSYTTYGLECPEKTWFAVQQFTDRKAYDECVENGQTGFSIHGDGALKLSKINPKINMKKKKMFVAKFSEATDTESGEVVVSVDALEEGAEVVVLDDTLKPIEDFSGDVVIDDQTVSIEGGKITAMVAPTEDVEMAEEEKPLEVEVEMMEDKKEEVEMSEEVVEEVEMAEEPVNGAMTEEQVLAVIQPKLDEIYKMIADLKVTETMEEVTFKEEEPSKVAVQMSKLEQLRKLTNK